jgi:hypothetical protein
LSLATWVAVGVFWFVVTRSFHPRLSLAVIVTTSLLVAYASAAYVNFLMLVPRFWATRRYGRYAATLLGTMALFTAAALAIIRTTYFQTLGPDPDPYGLYRHYAIDLFGMSVHMVAAAGVVWAFHRVVGTPSPSRAS